MYVDYGYYIIRPCRCPEFLKDFSQWILTASSCICDVEPQPFSCMTNDERQREEYRKRLGLEKREFIDFSEETLHGSGEMHPLRKLRKKLSGAGKGRGFPKRPGAPAGV